MAFSRKPPIKRGLSRLTHQDDPDIARLRREVDEEIRRLRMRQLFVDDIEDFCDGTFECLREIVDAGAGITIAFSSDPNTMEISAVGVPAINAQYVTMALDGTLTDERVLTAGTGITLTDGGAGGNATIATTITQYDDEMARDAIGAALVAGNGIDITVNDGANTITIDVDESELAMQAPQFVTLATTGALPNERALTAGHGIDLADAGAGSTITVDVDESELSFTGYATRFIATIPSLTINTDNTARTLLTAAISIPANTLSADGQVLRMTIFGNLLQNAAAGVTWIYVLSLNGVTLFQDTSAALSQSATRRPWRIDVLIKRIDSTHATASIIMFLSPVAAPTTGLGDFGTTGSSLVGGSSNTDVAGMDFTVAQNINLTAQCSSNSANAEQRVQGGWIEAS